MSRNELCACGSGKRYKHCHGKTETAAPTALHFAALAAHRSGFLERAEAMYRRAIDDNHDDVESLHMLGVVRFQRMRYREALDLLWDAAMRTGWADSTIRANLGLVLAKLLTPQANTRQEALVAVYVARERARKAGPVVAARVSVVLPVYNQMRFVARAIASVAAQSYKDIELVVIDDGSTDDTAAVVAERFSGLSFPATLVRREHKGAAQAANEGAERACGRYLAFVNADDWFAADRIERMVAEIARAQPLWGFSQVSRVSDSGDLVDSQPPNDVVAAAPGLLRDESASFTLLNHDLTGSSGNLFIERDLFRGLGGYRDMAQHRGWDFCVRAAEAVEPVAVNEPLYFRRGHDRTQVPGRAQRDTEQWTRELVASALTRDAVVENELCPQFVGNRDFLLRLELRAGHGDHIPVPILQALAATWRTRASAPPPRRRDVSAQENASKIALVVLGPYRSGTSALARALNLCGAALPEQVVAARLTINPTGFWESEAVNDLDARLLYLLRADWNRVDFDLPLEGPLVDEFLADSRKLLATEYGDAPFILIKDPRICVLAPLWQRTLAESGYRPVYVVPVRNPLEIARSLEARGAMPVAKGLALWLTYMQRVEAFIGTRTSDIVYVRYTELLDDWRRVLRLIARRLDVPLAIEPRADEVDRFLEAAMRIQQAGDAELDAYLAGAPDKAIRVLYRRSLERCERDAADPATRSQLLTLSR